MFSIAMHKSSCNEFRTFLRDLRMLDLSVSCSLLFSVLSSEPAPEVEPDSPKKRDTFKTSIL